VFEYDENTDYSKFLNQQDEKKSALNAELDIKVHEQVYKNILTDVEENSKSLQISQINTNK
jgi:hypothetical protein